MIVPFMEITLWEIHQETIRSLYSVRFMVCQSCRDSTVVKVVGKTWETLSFFSLLS